MAVTLDLVVQVGLLVLGLVMAGVWMYRNVWVPPHVLHGVMLERTTQNAGGMLPSPVPGGISALASASTTNILIISVDGQVRRFTANDESWRKAAPGDTVKVWLQNDTHVVGLYVKAHR